MPNIDVIIIGSGISALTAAYRISAEKNVIILTKSKITNSNSMLAQGGVASSVGNDDSWHSHFSDTVIAGCNHNREDTLEVLVKKGPEYILGLINEGLHFDVDENNLLMLGKEGAHSTRRILHAGGDATGRALILHMLEKVKNRVTIIEKETAIDLVIENHRCIGVYTLTQDGEIATYKGCDVILATGGCGALYSFTSNDPSITGDGLAMAYRAGAELVDLEFIQFHPTLLHIDGKTCGLVSEAVRGEGAVLVDETGRHIMNGKHPLLDLAPRDIVSRQLFTEMLAGRKIYLDVSMINDFHRRFPTITSLCLENGVALERGLIPVIPGAHFSMGGIKTDIKGRTSIPGLYAVGEVACTGVHGANRLASNSLLEGIVFGNLVADDILASQVQYKPLKKVVNKIDSNTTTTALPTKADIQRMMIENVGIVRNQERLKAAVGWFEKYKNELDGISPFSCTKEVLEIINMITVGWLVASSALLRTESRGGHFREDYPTENNIEWLRKEITRTCQNEELVYSF
ncbi:L-aspartate oxidase [Fredinandcohnia sp. 179-A 10B2 NHS]|uniref:L-aspartate oxidase n=1 Tax=Fredinandcohnia sp. 179-A 10B2 NHS TaxID=3235176 RepID=UPI0039A33847